MTHPFVYSAILASRRLADNGSHAVEGGLTKREPDRQAEIVDQLGCNFDLEDGDRDNPDVLRQVTQSEKNEDEWDVPPFYWAALSKAKPTAISSAKIPRMRKGNPRRMSMPSPIFTVWRIQSENACFISAARPRESPVCREGSSGPAAFPQSSC